MGFSIKELGLLLLPDSVVTIGIDAYEHGAVAYTDFLDLEAKPAARAGD